MAPLPSPQAMARTEIALMTEIFERDGDVSAAWRAFSLARRYGCDLPDSINREIDRFAEAVGDIAMRASHGDAKAALDNETVGKVWKGYKNRHAGGAAFRAHRAYAIAVAVERLRRAGFKSTDARLQIGREHGVSATIVSDAMKAHGYIQQMGDDELNTF